METGAKQRVTTSPTSAPGIAARMLSSCDGSSKARLAASSSGIVSSCVRHRSCNRGAGAHADERRIGRTAVQTAVLGEHTISADRIGRMIGQPLRAVFRTALRPTLHRSRARRRKDRDSIPTLASCEVRLEDICGPKLVARLSGAVVHEGVADHRRRHRQRCVAAHTARARSVASAYRSRSARERISNDNGTSGTA